MNFFPYFRGPHDVIEFLIATVTLLVRQRRILQTRYRWKGFSEYYWKPSYTTIFKREMTLDTELC